MGAGFRNGSGPPRERDPRTVDHAGVGDGREPRAVGREAPPLAGSTTTATAPIAAKAATAEGTDAALWRHTGTRPVSATATPAVFAASVNRRAPPNAAASEPSRPHSASCTDASPRAARARLAYSGLDAAGSVLTHLERSATGGQLEPANSGLARRRDDQGQLGMSERFGTGERDVRARAVVPVLGRPSDVLRNLGGLTDAHFSLRATSSAGG